MLPPLARPLGLASMRPRGQTPRMPEGDRPTRTRSPIRFNEAAGADPADANDTVGTWEPVRVASMRPRGQTPRMLQVDQAAEHDGRVASMRPRGQTPRMRKVSTGCKFCYAELQ